MWSRVALIGMLISVAPAPLASAAREGGRDGPSDRPTAAEIRQDREREAAAAAARAAEAERLRKENEKRLADIAAARKDCEDAAAQKSAADEAQKLAKELLYCRASSFWKNHRRRNPKT